MSENFRFRIIFLLCLLYENTDSNFVNFGGLGTHFPHIDTLFGRLHPHAMQ
ncbi:hypothetical protein ECHJAX_0945 [Ehrlichia chaffeensis str. Jax]|nr:hypothetical protein ECHJAX_0945 [Ehrlichia chaffeensis str. Jax]